MALWNNASFKSLSRMIDYMNGALVGSVNLHTGADVDSKTLIIDAGSGNVTCTFAPAKGRDWTLSEIVAEIEATVGLEGLASIRVEWVGHSLLDKDRRLVLQGDPAITIRGNGTANAELGYTEGATPADDTIQTIRGQNTLVTTYRNEDGTVRIQLADPVTSDVNLTEINGTTVVEGGVAGSLGVGGNTAAGDPAPDQPVEVGGVDGAGDLRTMATDTSGHVKVITPSGTTVDVNLEEVAGTATVEAGVSGVQAVGGPEAVGGAPSSYPAQVGGVDPSGNIIRRLLDGSGRSQTVGTQAPGADDSSWPVKGALTVDHSPSAQTDTHVRPVIGDDYGRVWTRSPDFDDTNDAAQVVGAESTGNAAIGKPVEVGGVDGSGDLRTLLMDTGGRPQNDLDRIAGTDIVEGGVSGSLGVGGHTAAGSAAADQPVEIGGVDGSGDLRTLLMDTGGRPQNDVDRIAGSDVATTGVSGTMPTEGTQAEETSADDGSFPVKIGGLIRDTLVALTDGRVAKSLFDLYGRLWVRQSNYTPATQSNRCEEIDPISAHYSDSSILIDDVDQDTVTTRHVISMAGYRYFSINWDISGGVTLTFFATNSPDADATADADWHNITPHLIGVTSTTDTEDMVIVTTPFPVSQLMVKRETSDATNDTEVWYKVMY